LAQKKPGRGAARKVKDKWRSKEWYRILAPDMFNSTQIAETLSDETDKVIGRVTEVTMQDLTGDFSKMHIKLQFRIHEISGLDAHTRFVGHSLTSDYIRRLTRRKHSKTDGVFDVQTKDQAIIRVKPMAVTEKRIQVSQQQAIRGIMGDIIKKEAAKSMSSEFIREMLSGNISRNILKACKPIYPLKRVEIRKSEMRRAPSEEIIAAHKKAEEEARRAEEERKKAEAKIAKDKAITEFTGIPGVAIANAEALFDSGFKNIEALSGATEEALAAIEGVGPELAKKIKEHLKPEEPEGEAPEEVE
jgi:small subunit ribosomal protein S3Ae